MRVSDADDAALCALLEGMGSDDKARPFLDLVLPGEALHGCTLDSLSDSLQSDRTAFLASLKQRGIPALGKRQRLVNAIGKWHREQVAILDLAALPPVFNGSEGLPIVYIHTGARPYLEVAVRTTASLHQPVYVLGDASVRAMVSSIPGVTFVSIADFRSHDVIGRARHCYVNWSSNPADFEFFCFERMFILRRFLEAWSLDRVMHLDSDCILLVPLSRFPLDRHRIWLVNNNYYHEHGFSPLPSASVHASVLDVSFCAQFERLFFEFYEKRAAQLPRHVAELREWAEAHAQRSGAGGVSDMTFYFLLQARPPSDKWADRTLGWVHDVGDLGAILDVDDPARNASDCRPCSTASDGRRWPLLTWMNNVSTGEGPDGVAQYAVERKRGARMIAMRRGDDGAILLCDLMHGARAVQACCAHFSGGAKVYLDPRWLRSELGIEVRADAV